MVLEHKIVSKLQFPVGARNGISDKNLLRQTIKHGIEALLEQHALTQKDITRILASGMITSEFGLVNLPHITAPAGLAQLHETMYETYLPDIADIPFVFVRGVKTDCSSLETADMMRGEETEIMGISREGAGIYVLPGSHSKIIQTDKNGAITEFKTMLTGEMIAAISENTILKDAFQIGKESLREAYLHQGFAYAAERGINDALFKVRILKNLFGKSASETYSFFMGIILCDEIRCILAANPARITIGGKKAIKDAMALLLRAHTSAPVVAIPEKEADVASVVGAIRIFEYPDIMPVT